MLNDEKITLPQFYTQIYQASKQLDFSMLSDLKTGALLRTLAASKPGGNFLELGTGTGLSLSWLAEGADEHTVITSIDNDSSFQQVAKDTFSDDQRINIICTDAAEWIRSNGQNKYDLIFADAWPGKFEYLDETLALVKTGGYYLIDDLLPQPNWPAGHDAKVDQLLEVLHQKTDFVSTTLNWSTGLILFTRIR